MKCIRCGYCCVEYDVMIVDPKYIDNVDLKDESCMKKVIHKKCGDICPHLEINNETNITMCKVHDKLWYNDTPVINIM